MSSHEHDAPRGAPASARRNPRASARRNPRAPSPADKQNERVWLYGLHTVVAALANPRRKVLRLVGTRNALARLQAAGGTAPVEPEEMLPRAIDRLVGPDAVHQGLAIETFPLPTLTLNELSKAHLIVVLDQITDPHNVGAILRSALAFGADAVVTTARHAPAGTGVLAKAASGALDRIPLITVTNLARALGEIGRLGYVRIGLDSDAETDLESSLSGERLALVLGAEGKGLRQLTRETCDVIARLAVPGPLASLNVSNAAAVSLYAASRALGPRETGAT